MVSGVAENRIKIVEDLIWQRVLAERKKPQRSCTIAIYKSHRDESGLTAERFHDALVAACERATGLRMSNLTDSDEFFAYEFGATLREPYLYLVEVDSSWCNAYQKKEKASVSLAPKRTSIKQKVSHSYKDLTVFNTGDITLRDQLLRIKGIKKDLLSILIQNAPHVCSFNTLRSELGSSAENKSLLKYRSDIDHLLADAGLSNAIHPCSGMGLRIEY